MALRPCLGSDTQPQGHTLVANGNRCPECRAGQQHSKDARRPERRTYAEQQRRRHAVAEHVSVYGWWCPGLPELQRAQHASTDLTADHLDDVAGGAPEGGPLRVLCRSCNSARGARNAAARTGRRAQSA